MAAKFDLVVAAKTVGAGSIKRLGNSMQGVQGRVKNTNRYSSEYINGIR